MKVVLFIREALPEGGLSLSAFRLGTALVELGHEAEVLYLDGDPPPSLEAVGRRIATDTGDEVSQGHLSHTFERANPDIVLVGSESLTDLEAAQAVAPTALHAHLHIGVCPDHARYWSRLQRPCGVRAGWHCAALRPLLGCSELKRSVDPSYILTQRRLRECLMEHDLGVVCVGSDQAELFVKHGISKSKVTVLPNLGIRATATELAAASRDTPRDWRDATVFIGRLSKTKGGQLLDPLARSLSADMRFRIFGDGYLADGLSSLPDGVLCGQITQDSVMGVLMWARGVVFPSLWPEPGGIVGVDAQVMGVPLAAFEAGAARYWPAARRFSLGDVEEMSRWAEEQAPRDLPRDPESVAEAQATYWNRVATRGAQALGEFASGRQFKALGAPAEGLISGPGAAVA